MPPTLGGKSFVTTRTLGSPPSISSQRGLAERSDGAGTRGNGVHGVGALDAGSGFAPLPGWRVLAVRGDDARAWLHDLVTADVASLPTATLVAR